MEAMQSFSHWEPRKLGVIIENCKRFLGSLNSPDYPVPASSLLDDLHKIMCSIHRTILTKGHDGIAAGSAGGISAGALASETHFSFLIPLRAMLKPSGPKNSERSE